MVNAQSSRKHRARRSPAAEIRRTRRRRSRARQHFRPGIFQRRFRPAPTTRQHASQALRAARRERLRAQSAAAICRRPGCAPDLISRAWFAPSRLSVGLRAAKMRGVVERGTAMIAMWERVCNAVEKHRSRTRSSFTRVPCRSVIGVVGRRSRGGPAQAKD
jgi:hypothetical protein